jgi:hypothetical protein
MANSKGHHRDVRGVQTHDVRVTASKQVWLDFEMEMARIGITKHSEQFRSLMIDFVRGGKGLPYGSSNRY